MDSTCFLVHSFVSLIFYFLRTLNAQISPDYCTHKVRYSPFNYASVFIHPIQIDCLRRSDYFVCFIKRCIFLLYSFVFLIYFNRRSSTAPHRSYFRIWNYISKPTSSRAILECNFNNFPIVLPLLKLLLCRCAWTGL